ncbi:MAG: Alw26I/Eco31I/Esp3I family type II restriction adenine-specific DNA-methyltransferase [Candidatus Ratteibacteria bacterium]|jgi:Alw26I/Eco31I/Esp3I family type II restriction m6 adenine DNA methyltransferase
MKHLEHTRRVSASKHYREKTLFQKTSGKFYTPIWMAQLLAKKILYSIHLKTNILQIVDPFCGDGRLLIAIAERIARCSSLRMINYRFELWDKDGENLAHAKAALYNVIRSTKLKARVHTRQWDTFLDSTNQFGQFDLVVTNPPWEALKPDNRELIELSILERRNFIDEMRDYDKALGVHLPYSQPANKLYGWGTNLSRCGLEIAINLLGPNGRYGIVLPSSILADQVSVTLRKWLLHQTNILSIDYFPAETKPFKQVDQPSIIMIAEKQKRRTALHPIIAKYDYARKEILSERILLSDEDLHTLGFRIPAELSTKELALLLKLSKYRPISDWDVSHGGKLWMGRELDETRYRSFISNHGKFAFLKGRTVTRFSNVGPLTEFVKKGTREIPTSACYHRIAWRDVSRRSQTRRMVATIIPPGVVTGNSLHVAYFVDNNQMRLHALLGILNSLAFEFQLRARLGTGHVSLGSVRDIRVPDLNDISFVRILARLAKRVLSGESAAEAEIEVVIADAYNLSQSERNILLNHFTKLAPEFSNKLRIALKIGVHC